MSDIDLWNIDLLDTHLDLSDTDIPSKHFVCLHDLLKTSSKHAFKTSSRRVFNISSRRLQHKNFFSSKTPWRRLARCLQDVLEDEKLLRRRRVEDVFRTCLEDALKASWKSANVYWDATHSFVLRPFIFKMQ